MQLLICVQTLVMCGPFLNVYTVLDLLRSPSYVHPCVPRGIKSDVTFVVNNEDNVKRAQQGHQNAFCDDCGAWQDGRVFKAYILRSNRKQIRHVNGVYCQRKIVNKKVVDVPIEPQPAAVDVIELVRYYTRLKRDGQYQRRVTWTVEYGGVALYEYLGKFPNTVAEHGNAKKCAREYVRTHVDVLGKIKQTLKESHSKPRDVYEHITLHGGFCCR